jgi:hypothetical protein
MKSGIKSAIVGLGIVVGSVCALIGTIWTFLLAWGIWHGGTLKGLGWHIGPNPIVALLVFLIGWEIVAGLCYVVGILPFLGLAALFPEPEKTEQHA